MQTLIRNCVKARIKLRTSAFSSSVREKPIVKNLIRQDIFTESLFPPGSYDKIQSLIGRNSVNLFLAPNRYRHLLLYFWPKSFSLRQSSYYRKALYSSRDSPGKSYHSPSSSSRQAPSKVSKPSPSQESQGNNSNFNGSSQPPTRGRGHRRFSN